MDPKELRGLMEAYVEVYAPQQLDEISQKTATSAYAQRRTGEFEGDDASDRVAKTNKLKGRIEKKFGAKAGEHAERAADVKTFGRKDASGRRKQSPQPRIQTSDHENQREFKRELRIRRDRRLRAARGEDTNEQFDIFDVVLEFLQVEGYAETLEEAEWMMSNVLDEEAIAIITELTGGKGHPGYKAGSRDHGPMQSGHPADTFKRTMKGGTMSQRHGDHLGDLDDDDDDEDDLEAGLKDTARKKRENVRKPLRDKVKAARKVLSKEEYVDEGAEVEKSPYHHPKTGKMMTYGERQKQLKDKAERIRSARNEEYMDEGHGSRRSFKQQSKDERWRVNTFNRPGSKVEYTPHKNYDPEANRGQGQILRPNQAEKQRRKKLAKAAMGEDFELWVNSLVDEGYDLSGYTWDEMFDIYEAEKPFPYEKVKAQQKKHTNAGRYKNMIKMGMAVRRAKEAEKTGVSQQDAGKGWYHAKEDYVNEAQAARENPEKYEREQAKKSAPVRGERTPMPPRGDKRREDFEKWYAANVR